MCSFKMPLNFYLITPVVENATIHKYFCRLSNMSRVKFP